MGKLSALAESFCDISSRLWHLQHIAPKIRPNRPVLVNEVEFRRKKRSYLKNFMLIPKIKTVFRYDACVAR
jgi:hypothetical protein